ncbi:isocitrate/isopropylmalate family dehydrogenase [Acaryochloris sp. IP29b_bin.148]|uniref:isocitrate/isopropylmalate family dehydrogenase n=1 Tax=Acaryochloris sp. IP29b_bin.148 TaxID=2969218 RepID=UPI00261802F8|nr:isocitrate/isopropylmalate family dehydrogenase [Acaryochloris sp. IP29b_bin.148]
MGYPVTLIRDSGVEAEVTNATQIVLEATGVDFNWQIVDVGTAVIDRYGTPFPDAVLESIQKTKTVLKGPIALPLGQDGLAAQVELCQQLNLYAHLRSAKSIAGIQSRFSDMDLVIVQENTEDFYAGIEFERTTIEAADARSVLSKLSGQHIREDSAVGIRTISVKGCGQIIEFAFNYAQANGRRQVTAIHQAHQRTATDRLFLDIACEVAKEFPDIKFEDRRLETACLQLMQTPNHFDVLVMPNSYGDLLFSLCAGISGGLGVAPNAFIGDEYAVFESAAPPCAGDPTALILSGGLMLQHLGEQKAAQKLQKAVEAVIAAQTHVTADLASMGTEPVGPQAMAQAIAEAMV